MDNFQLLKIKLRIKYLQITLFIRSTIYKFKHRKELKNKPKPVEQPQKIYVNVDKYANPKCDICYGRGYDGRNAKTKKYVTCSCIVKTLRKAIANKELKIEANSILYSEKMLNEERLDKLNYKKG